MDLSPLPDIYGIESSCNDGPFNRSDGIHFFLTGLLQKILLFTFTPKNKERFILRKVMDSSGPDEEQCPKY